VPAYNHGSEVEALLQVGVTCRFYAGTPRLDPDEAELDELMTPAVKGLLVIHYLGFPQDMPRWRAWCDGRGILLLEDAAQSWLAHSDSRPVGSFGDLAIFSLYKTFGVPDGGALVCRRPAGRATRRELGIGSLSRRHAAWLIGRSGRMARLLSPLEKRPELVTPASEFALGDPGTGPSAATRMLLPRIADPSAAVHRRDNYAFLLEHLRELVPSPFEEMPAEASPFFFPLSTERKPELIAELRTARIHALDFWTMAHPSLPPAQFSGAAERRERTLGLPVHQELRHEDLARMVRAVRDRTAAGG
jgi:dTDP-4-amino-4,6-dideoxygalactose transaminase